MHTTPHHRRLGTMLLSTLVAMLAFAPAADAATSPTIPGDGRTVRLEAEAFTRYGGSGPVVGKSGATFLKLYGNGFAGTWVQNPSAGNKLVQAVGLIGEQCVTSPVAYISVYSYSKKAYLTHTPFTLRNVLGTAPISTSSGTMMTTVSSHSTTINAPANDWLFVSVGFWNDDYRPGICDSNVLLDAIDVTSLNTTTGTIGLR